LWQTAFNDECQCAAGTASGTCASLLLLLLAVPCRYFAAQQLSRPELGCEVVDEGSFRLVPQPGGRGQRLAAECLQQQQQQ
jgi:hypothetical protein